MRLWIATPLALSSGLLLAGCGSAPRPADQVSIVQHYRLVDDRGRAAGQVTLSPLGQGQVIDNNGQIIGQVVPASGQSLAPTSYSQPGYGQAPIGQTDENN